MKITKEQVLELHPCDEGRDWFLENGKDTEDLKELLLRINAKRFDWASWLFAMLMKYEQYIELCIFAAREVLPIFEKEYPEDGGPRKAIESAENWLKEPTEKNRNIAEYNQHKAFYDIPETNYNTTQAVYAAVSILPVVDIVFSTVYAAVRANPSIKIKLINKAVEILNKEVEK